MRHATEWFRLARVRKLLFLVLLLFLVACASNSGSVAGRVSAVVIVNAPVILERGEVRVLTVDVTATGGVSRAVSWSTGDANVLTVVNGTVTAVGGGSTTVWAVSVANPGVQASVSITVVAPPAFDGPVAPGAAQATCGGDVCAVTTTVESTRVSLVVGGVEVGLSARSAAGGAVSVGEGGVVLIPSGGALALGLSGLEPTAPVSVWLIREGTSSTLMQSVFPGVDGAANLSVSPSNLGASSAIAPAASSAVSLLISATSRDGDVISLHVGIAVEGAGGGVGDEAGVVSVTIAGDATRTLSVGDTAQLIATVTVVGNAATTIVWSSSVPSVASVSANGLVAALAGGTTVVTASSAVDPTKSASVSVKVPGVSSIVVDGGTARALQTGQSTQLTTTVTTLGEGSTAVSWSTANASVATVSAGGLVTAVSAGVTTITATSVLDATKSVVVSVTVTDAPPQPAVLGLTVNGSSTRSLNVGASAELEVTVTAVGGAATTVTWSSSVPSVASVGVNGLVTALVAGTSVITATSVFDPMKTASVTLNVPGVSSVVIAGDAVRSLSVGATDELLATVVAAGGAATTVTWSSSVSSVASVSTNGRVTALAGGSTVITAASTVDPAKSANVTINVPVVVVSGVAPSSWTVWGERLTSDRYRFSVPPPELNRGDIPQA
jgi:uncharacterized protein YjdB